MALDPLFLLTARYVVGGVFIISAVAKIVKWHDFIGIVANYRLLPKWAVRPVAWVIPPVEAWAALGFGTGWAPALSTVAIWILLIIFTGAIVVNLLRGRAEIDCGCLGPLLRQRIGWWMVVRNGVLMGLAGLGYPGWATMSRPYGLVDTLFSGLAALVLLAVYATFQLLWTRTSQEWRVS
ncbi:MAG: DoxX family protein [Acidobacteria bacterium]|nr:DoxX family protein [Acidobacteriota bacterium]MDW7985468.1 MauE/DoxX family redox-associated membrane protein [Acidobacteriota bacterium]